MQLLSSTRRPRNNGVNGNGCGQNVAAILLLPFCVLALIATVASVPTSVLAQNTELSSNANNLNANKKSFVQQQLTKVKRSSNNNNNNHKENENVFGTNEIDSSSTLAPTNNLDKKSSPEIVPASFSNLPPAAKPISNANNNYNNNQQPQAGLYALPSNSEIMAAVEAAAVAANNQQQQQQQQQYYADADDADNMPISSMHKRGISSQQYLYDTGLGSTAYLGNAANVDYYGNPYAQNGFDIAVPNGVWSDELEPVPAYADLQDLDDYVPVQRAGANNRNKAYDNLQNLLNTEAYLESVPLSVPLQYANRNYGILDGERNKRGGYYNPAGGTSLTFGGTMNKYNSYGDTRTHKRDNTKLTPADMLALVALVEAGERARKETDADAGYLYPGDNYAPKSYTPGMPAAATGAVYDYGTAADDVDYNAGGAGTANGNWLDAPAVVDYYGVPVNVESAMPKYDFVPREHKYGNGNRYGGSSKRFMVAKKKRSVGKYLNNGDKYY